MDGDGEAGGVDAFEVVGGDDDGGESEFFGFEDALLDAGDGSDLSGESDFAGEAGGVGNGDIDVG